MNHTQQTKRAVNSTMNLKNGVLAVSSKATRSSPIAQLFIVIELSACLLPLIKSTMLIAAFNIFATLMIEIIFNK